MPFGFTKKEKAVQRKAAVELGIGRGTWEKERAEELAKQVERDAEEGRRHADEWYWSLCDMAEASAFADIAVARGVMKRPEKGEGLSFLGQIQYDTMLACNKVYRFVIAPKPTAIESGKMPAFISLYWLHESLTEEEQLVVLEMKCGLPLVNALLHRIAWHDLMSFDNKPNVALLTLRQCLRRNVMPSRFVLEIIDGQVYREREHLYDELLAVTEQRERDGLPLGMRPLSDEEAAKKTDQIAQMMAIESMMRGNLPSESDDPTLEGLNGGE